MSSYRLRERVGLPALSLYLIILAVIGVALRIARRPRAAQPVVIAPVWDIPLRVVLATAFVLALTGASDALGATWSGLISPIPLYASLMVAYAHVQDGADGALRVLLGVLLGTFAFASFFLVAGAAVTAWPLWLVYVSASLTAMFNLARR